MAPTLFKPGAQWAILPTVQRLYDEQDALDAARMRELASRCLTALTPRPRDFTNVCLVTGRKELRDYLRVGISQGTGLRYGMEFSEVESFARAQELPAWLNRVFLVSAGADLDGSVSSSGRWSLPLDRMEFYELRAKHDQFIYTRRNGPRVEFILYASDDTGLIRVIDHFKRLDKLTIGLSQL